LPQLGDALLLALALAPNITNQGVALALATPACKPTISSGIDRSNTMLDVNRAVCSVGPELSAVSLEQALWVAETDTLDGRSAQMLELHQASLIPETGAIMLVEIASYTVCVHPMIVVGRHWWCYHWWCATRWCACLSEITWRM
jgi:hypothetical protein